MLKKILCIALCTLSISSLAATDFNKADQATLDGIKGIGPVTAKKILDERKKGEFKNWQDLQDRVSGISKHKAEQIAKAGFVINQASPKKSTKPAVGYIKADAFE